MDRQFRTVLFLSVVIYATSWFLPVIKGGITLDKGGLPGWEAFTTALTAQGEAWWARGLYASSALTNFVFLGALAALSFRPYRFARIAQWILLSSTVLNMHWFILNDDRGDLRIGYYLWVTSFAALTFAARLASRHEPGSGHP